MDYLHAGISRQLVVLPTANGIASRSHTTAQDTTPLFVITSLFGSTQCHGPTRHVSVLRLQGTKGVVRAEGNAYWRWVDVLISWSPAVPTSTGGLSGSALALAIALPVVFGVLLLAACGVGAVWLRRRR